VVRLKWHNNAFKLLSLMLAFVLWVYVSNEQNPVREKNINISLEYSGLGQDFIITEGMPESIEVKVKGSSSQLANLAPWSFKAVVDLPEGKAGDMVLPVRVTAPAGLEVSQVSPEEVALKVDRLVDRKVSVAVELRGTPARGYAAQTPECQPDTVIVRGPATVVNSIDRVNAVVNIDAAQADIEQDIPVDAGPHNVSLSPTLVKVTVPVSGTFIDKTVPVLTRVSGSPAEGFLMTGSFSEPATVRISGPAAVLNEINAVETEVIDVQGAEQSLNREVQLSLPPDVEAMQPDRVQLIVEISAEEEPASPVREE
jgi:YbbR domain-containing protein